MIFDGRTIKVFPLETDQDGIVEMRFEREQESVNKLDVLAFDELRRATAAIAAAQGIKGLLITSAKDAFIVGADIFEFLPLFKRPNEEVAGFVEGNCAIITALGDLPVPSVALINGLALGGGLELALAADYRVMAATAAIGVPEIHLGLFPGYGGTVRLPRLIGLGPAAEWVMSGAQHKAEAALAAGAVDAVASPEGLRVAALTTLRLAIRSEADWRGRRAELRKGLALSTEEISHQLGEAKAKAQKAMPHFPAAHLAVELLASAAGLDRDAALALEAETFAKAAKTQAASSLVQIFINEQALKKTSRTVAKTATPVKKAAVIGAGVMGGGIAYQSASRGTPILMKDISEAAIDLGMAEAKKQLAKQVETGRLAADKADAIATAITPSLTYEGLADADIVIEAVVENLGVKQKVFAEVEALTGPAAILASNTSSLRIGDLAQNLQRPGNFVGMHFFNPVPRMPLVEIVHGPQTSDQTLATTLGFALALGKTPVIVKDCPGFVVNRILTPYIIGFLRLLHDGVDFVRIDEVMEKFGWPMGPAYLVDVIGMDISFHVVDIVSAGYTPRMTPGFETAIDVLLRENRLGQKNGRGFYKYENDPKGRPRKLTDPETDALLAPVRPKGKADVPEADIIERMMLPLILEAARCVEDQIVTAPGEVDMSLILGLGLPRYLGGALKYADYLGLSNVVTLCDKWRELGPIYHPSEVLRTRAERGELFYPG
jgi:3-hydroxyacyl-CoA dehydrogenase/enoyl-CoA hydratase/3-hydroxybutyryl-CoA epimerase/enoyl-CoA isomerase